MFAQGGQVTVYSYLDGVEEFTPETTAGRLESDAFVYADGTRLTLTDASLTWPQDSLLEGAVFTATAILFTTVGRVFFQHERLLEVVIGALMYAAGLVLSAWAITPGQMQLLEILVGFGIAGTGFGVVLAIVGRAASAENRSMALGIATAAGSAGQVFGAPVAEILLQSYPWQTVFVIFAVVIVASLAALPFLSTGKAATKAELEESLGTVLVRAFKDPTYTLIFLGFFSCGYQLAFITAHFPAFITDFCGAIDGGGMLAGLGITTTSALGAVSISVIGLFNIVGTLTAGWLGKRYSKKYLLAGIYTGRTIAAAVFILLPITPASVLIFSAVMGALWLATVPLTSGLVAHIYGIRYMGTLYGFVFLSHQIGGFLGVWLGGKMFDITGDYTLVWWIGVGVGAFSAIVHLPIREKPWAAKLA